MKSLDLRVYIITSEVPELGRTHEQVAAAAIAGGATIIQFRDKTINDRQFAETAKRLLDLAHTSDIPLIINDRVEIAIEVGADGVHIGQTDGDVRTVRNLLPAGMVLGVSATEYAEAMSLTATGADYLGVGPIFTTRSKDDASPAVGDEELARICRNVSKPVVAIGGINGYNLKRIMDAGVAGAAVISAVTHAPDMSAAVTSLRRIWDGPAQTGSAAPTHC